LPPEEGRLVQKQIPQSDLFEIEHRRSPALTCVPPCAFCIANSTCTLPYGFLIVYVRKPERPSTKLACAMTAFCTPLTWPTPEIRFLVSTSFRVFRPAQRLTMLRRINLPPRCWFVFRIVPGRIGSLLQGFRKGLWRQSTRLLVLYLRGPSWCFFPSLTAYSPHYIHRYSKGVGGEAAAPPYLCLKNQEEQRETRQRRHLKGKLVTLGDPTISIPL